MRHRTWLLFNTALIESGTGLILIGLPSFFVELLFGQEITEPITLVIARLAGVAILVISIMCYLARNDQPGPATMGIVTGMLVYNIVVAVLLAYAGIGLKLTGLLLWPAVVLHVALAFWCMAAIRDADKQNDRA